MKHKFSKIGISLIVASLLLAACGSITSMLQAQPVTNAQPAASAPQPQQQSSQATTNISPTTLNGYETALENIYLQVNPSVVSIHVVQQQASINSQSQTQPFFNLPGVPNFFGSPNLNNNQPTQPQYSEALGSGFIWSSDGYIVTNNHVISGASKIEVKFSDGTTVPATLVGADPDSDLAVVKVDNPGFTLTPITLNGSGQTQVGQVAVAIGNPFGLENTMTVGIVSALGRTLPANQITSNGATYSIPDIIQTDAPINPGNSGGPLVDDQGQLIGVTSAIESPVSANAGVGFAIPATIVQNVVPALIKDGKYEHTYLGISGTTLTPDLATAMNLDAMQRGALVEEIVPGGPADTAKLLGSAHQATINGQNVNVGGDVITAIDSTPVKTMDDLIAYLADHTTVNQKVMLTILRNGKEQTIDVTLLARPAQQTTTQTVNTQAQAPVWLGIAGQGLTAEINQAMNLSLDQQGVLVEQVQAGSPADKAGLQGSFKPVIINGQRVLIGGDVITAIDGTSVASVQDLQAYLQNAQDGQKVSLSILRDGQQQNLMVTLAPRQ